MGLSTWFHGDWTGFVLYASIILLPLIVGRWWVVAALAGPFIAFVALESTGYVYEGGSDGPETSSLFPWGIIALFFWELLMLALVAIRKTFDVLRSRGVTAIRRHRARVASGADS